jgi:hypothetical protein
MSVNQKTGVHSAALWWERPATVLARAEGEEDESEIVLCLQHEPEAQARESDLLLSHASASG